MASTTDRWPICCSCMRSPILLLDAIPDPAPEVTKVLARAQMWQSICFFLDKIEHRPCADGRCPHCPGIGQIADIPRGPRSADFVAEFGDWMVETRAGKNQLMP